MLKNKQKSGIIVVDLLMCKFCNNIIILDVSRIKTTWRKTIMIDTKNYILVEGNGYNNKSEAYDTIRLCYSTLKGVTTYYDNGLWYIVQMKALM